MLGHRLKEARVAAGLSQRQLCGQEITRNMLSQIESGKARPSMQTLQYLAGQLGKPVSWFLEEQPEPVADLTGQARDLYRDRQYLQCLELLEEDKDLSEEAALLRILSLLALAQQAVVQQRHHYARSLLERVGHLAETALYYTPQLERERLLLLFQTVPEQAGDLEGRLPADHRELLLRARGRLAAGDYPMCICLLRALPEQDATWHYLYGQALMGQGEYAAATEHFLAAEQAYPTQCAKALESCYRELEDYKQAYLYACKQRT